MLKTVVPVEDGLPASPTKRIYPGPDVYGGVYWEYVRLPEVLHTIGVSRATIHRMIRRGEFPPPMKISLRTCVWEEGSINEWIADRVSENGC